MIATSENNIDLAHVSLEKNTHTDDIYEGLLDHLKSPLSIPEEQFFSNFEDVESALDADDLEKIEITPLDDSYEDQFPRLNSLNALDAVVMNLRLEVSEYNKPESILIQQEESPEIKRRRLNDPSLYPFFRNSLQQDLNFENTPTATSTSLSLKKTSLHISLNTPLIVG